MWMWYILFLKLLIIILGEADSFSSFFQFPFIYFFSYRSLRPGSFLHTLVILSWLCLSINIQRLLKGSSVFISGNSEVVEFTGRLSIIALFIGVSREKSSNLHMVHDTHLGTGFLGTSGEKGHEGPPFHPINFYLMFLTVPEIVVVSSPICLDG